MNLQMGVSGQLCGSANVKQEREISRMIRSLSEHITELENVAERLRSRLDPILNQQEKCQRDTQPTEPLSCVFAQGLRELSDRAINIANNIQETIDRVEI